MAMVCGLDLHRRQITFDTLETVSGEEWRGRIWQPDRARFRRWLREDVARRANGEVALAVEGCTGWRYVVEEITAAGFEAHVAEPADTQAARGRKHRAKTDRTDARLLRDLLAGGELPESWIPPEPVLEWRERVRLYKSLVDQRTVWCQRIHAELYHHGVAVLEGAIRSDKTRGMLADPHVQLSPAARERIAVGYRMIDLTDTEAQPLKKALTRFGTRQPACKALVEAQYGIGGLIAVAAWSELGDCRRFSRSDQAVRHTGLDVSVDASDRRRAGGYLSRQGPETLRWALYEAAKNASHHRSPDHDYYAQSRSVTAARSRRSRSLGSSRRPPTRTQSTAPSRWQPGSCRHPRGPVRVTSGSELSRSLAAAIKSSRPIRLVGGATRLCPSTGSARTAGNTTSIPSAPTE